MEKKLSDAEILKIKFELDAHHNRSENSKEDDKPVNLNLDKYKSKFNLLKNLKK